MGGRGLTDETSEVAAASTARLVSGEAWQDFCQVIARAGTMIDRFDDASDLERDGWDALASATVHAGDFTD